MTSTKEGKGKGALARGPRASSGGLKRSPGGVNRGGGNYVEVLDGVLYVDRAQAKAFKAELRELCGRYDYRFVPADETAEREG